MRTGHSKFSFFFLNKCHDLKELNSAYLTFGLGIIGISPLITVIRNKRRTWECRNICKYIDTIVKYSLTR